MVSKHLIWIKVPTDMNQASIQQMSDILQTAFKGSEFGFFIVPDRFDVLSRAEVKLWLEATLQELNMNAAEENMR